MSVAALLATGAERHKHYRPSSWNPHDAIATRTPGALLPVAVKAVSDVLPVALTVAHAAIAVTATGELWPLPGIP